MFRLLLEGRWETLGLIIVGGSVIFACVILYYEHLKSKAETTESRPPSIWVFGVFIFALIFGFNGLLLDVWDWYVVFWLGVISAAGTWYLLK